jgi:hypothetical protein
LDISIVGDRSGWTCRLKAGLEPRCRKHGGRYDITDDEDSYIKEIRVEEAMLSEAQIRDLTGALKWTLERAFESLGSVNL